MILYKQKQQNYQKKGLKMADLVFTVNAVLPIILLVLIGYVLKRAGLIGRELAKGMNKLTFRLFLPVMLFLNVYKIESISDINLGFAFYTVIAIIFVFFIGVCVSIICSDDNKRRGVIAQAAFRSNYALIGIPLAESIFGSRGSSAATLLSVFAIPLFNILAVISLSVFKREENSSPKIKNILIDIAKNPLIQAILIGAGALLLRALFVRAGITFRLSDINWLYGGVLSKLSAVATPLALISLGADFEFSKTSEMKKEIIAATLLRCVVTPILGLGVALIIGGFEGAHYAAFVAVFASPIAVSSVPMTEAMGSDYNLAGQIVVWTTLVSAFTLFVYIYLLRIIGVF